MSCRLLLIAAFSVAFSNSAFANWWIVRSSDGECLVVDIEPTGTGVTKVGKEVRFKDLSLTLIEVTCAGVTELPSAKDARHC